jgi:hypothetical protein
MKTLRQAYGTSSHPGGHALAGAGPLLLGLTLLATPVGAASPVTFQHSEFDALLHRHVRAGRVDYDAFAHSPRFEHYLESLATFDPEQLGERDRLAFWINAYNAYTIHLINVKGERESIRNINKTLGLLKLDGPWKEPIARVGGRSHTLDEIEHEIIRKRFHEPRVHFALVCGALGCPELRSEAYSGGRLEAQLAAQARVFVLESPAKNRVDVAARVVYVSPIFDWFKDDFGGSDAAIGRYLAGLLPEGPERRLLLEGDFDLRTTAYDWNLNAQRQAR